MANDIQLSISSKSIHNGSIILMCSKTGKYSSNLSSSSSKPNIQSIESKYDNRFDDVGYYFGGGNSDGGFYGITEDVLGV
jgi:hypothetical protein